MAEKIEQEFLINASQALSILGRLDQAFLSFENRLKSVATSIQAFNSGGTGQAFASLNTQAAQAATSLAKVQAAVTGVSSSSRSLSVLQQRFGQVGLAIQQVGSLTNSAGVSFETLARIVQAQVIVRAINAIRDAATEAAQQAGELQKQIALIRTIATGANGGEGRIGVDTQQIATAVREISDNLNIPQLEVAEGLYNAISNQVGNFTESLQFASQAGRFAKATNATLAESVDTLSAVLRSYNLGVDQTERVSNVLFATIDKGRVTADELANTLGRVLPAANELGVPLEEVAAAVANISDKGLSTDETLTQVRATFTGLLKPSDALKEAYDRLGIASGEVGIRTFGFGGLLQKLRTEAGQTSSELAALFPNVRNLGGVLAITGVNAENYANTLRDITDASGLADQAFDIATDTDFERVTAALNKLKNVAIELGDEFLGTVADYLEAAGGADQFAESAEFVLRTIVSLIPQVTALGAGLLLTSNAARALGLALAANPILLAAVAVTGLTTAAIQYDQAVRNAEFERIEDHFKTLREFDASQVQGTLKRLGQSSEDSLKQFDLAIRGGLVATQEVVAAYRGLLPVIQDADAKLVTGTKGALDDIVNAREGLVRELGNASAESARIAEASIQRVADLEANRGAANFDRSIQGLGDAQQVLKLTERSQQLARKAAEDLIAAGRTGNERGIKSALDAFGDSERLALTAEDIAKRTGNRALEAQAVAKVAETVNTQLTAERELQNIQKSRQVALDRERARQAQIADELKRQAKIVVDNAGQFDKDGRQFSEAELARRARESSTALETILNAQFSKGDIDLAAVLGVADFANKFQRELTTSASQVKLNLDIGQQQISDQLTIALSNFNAAPLTVAVRDALSLAVNEAFTPDDLERRIDDLSARFKSGQKAGSDLTIAQQEASGARQRVQEALDALDALNAPRQANPALEVLGGFRDLSNAIEQGRREIQSLLDEGVGPDELTQGYREVADSINSVLENLRQRGDTSAGAFLEDSQILNLLNTELTTYRDGLLKIQEGEQALGDTIDPEKLQKVFDLQDSTNQTSANLGNAAINAGSLADQINRIDTSRLNFGGLSGINAAFGANIASYFNSGGLARGVDTVPAMLAHGESVINARSTSKFFSQIQAMNAGQQPVFRAANGGVTNVGDINVTVQGQSNSSATGRAIASELRRELRRGTSRL